MSTQSESGKSLEEKSDLELFREIRDDEEFDPMVRRMAEVLVEGIEEGRIDAN